MRSAIRTVENRCDTRTVMRPSSLPSRDAAANRSNNECSVSASSAAVGSSSTHSSGLVAHESASERELLPLADRQLDTFAPRRAELRVEPVGQAVDHVAGAGARHRHLHHRHVVESVDVTDTDAAPGLVLEPEEVLERAGQPVAPLVARAAATGRRRRR